MYESSAVGTGALEDVAYLSRSENRIRILDALASEAYPRRELRDVTCVSRTTLGRILRELEKRGWVERRADGNYESTPEGELVVAQFTSLVEALTVVRTLGEAATWIPLAELPIGLRDFSDATVHRSEPHAPLQLVEYLADLVRNGSTFRVLTFLAPPAPLGEAMQAGATDGRLTMEAVLTDGLVTYLRDEADSPPRWREFLESGSRIYRYDGRLPCNLFVVDETVLVMSDRPEGRSAAIESENEAVRAGFDDLFDRYRAESESVAPEFFA